MESLRRVVIAGHVCIDENITATATVRAIGSPAAFMAPVLEANGVEVRVAAPHGRDFGALEAQDAATRPLAMLEPARGDHTLVFVNDVRGERRRQSVRRIGSARLAHPDEAVRRALGVADALLFAPLLADPPVSVVADYVCAVPVGALRMVLLQGYLRQAGEVPDARGDLPVRSWVFAEVPELMALFDVAVLSDEDVPDVDRLVDGWAAAHPGVAIVVTRGPRGASVHRGRFRQDVPAYAVGPIAPEALIGAGDVFAAELALALLEEAGEGRPRGADGEAGRGLDPNLLTEAVARANRATALRLVSH
ncbi:hypothetical protein [Herbiconiux sp.]|uniref:hypothetical protein n=1 Tax=Herbiconiux sp. TaxID=1871186 RepID=UPI0025C4157F|nr:hypothetical protein [Herbiconiux sp.]